MSAVAAHPGWYVLMEDGSWFPVVAWHTNGDVYFLWNDEAQEEPPHVHSLQNLVEAEVLGQPLGVYHDELHPYRKPERR